LGVLAVIFAGMTVMVMGAPGARADSRPLALMDAPQAVKAPADGPTLAPHPSDSRSLSSHTSSGAPAMPSPRPQAPPLQRPADQGIAYPMAGAQAVGRGGFLDRKLVPDAQTKRQVTAFAPEVVMRPPTMRASASNRHASRPTHAARMISADRLNRSLVYSSAVALAIAAGGLLMLGSRRRLW
jgi:hypothetical protein